LVGSGDRLALGPGTIDVLTTKPGRRAAIRMQLT